ncbi:MAG: NADH-quinone oxidoreductase subunit A [Actinomycetota bacterium]
MSDYFRSYGTLGAFVLVGIGFFALAMAANWVLRPSRPRREKLLTYECGIDPVGVGWSQTQIRYYIFAFFFVVFDVESVFLFPWALVLERLGVAALVEMAVFIGVLALALLYGWKKGVLKWV